MSDDPTIEELMGTKPKPRPNPALEKTIAETREKISKCFDRPEQEQPDRSVGLVKQWRSEAKRTGTHEQIATLRQLGCAMANLIESLSDDKRKQQERIEELETCLDSNEATTRHTDIQSAAYDANLRSQLLSSQEREKRLREALKWLVDELEAFDTWERPSAAFDNARAALQEGDGNV